MTGAKPSLLRRMLGELQISSWTQVKNLEALHLHSNAACHPKHSSNAGRVLDRKDSSDASANCGNGRRTCCQLQDLNPKTIHCPRNMRLDGLICNSTNNHRGDKQPEHFRRPLPPKVRGSPFLFRGFVPSQKLPVTARRAKVPAPDWVSVAEQDLLTCVRIPYRKQKGPRACKSRADQGPMMTESIVLGPQKT